MKGIVQGWYFANVRQNRMMIPLGSVRVNSFYSMTGVGKTTEVLKEGLKKITEETDNITKTFMTNSKEKRDCEKYMHRLIYNELGKDSIRDQLFHGLLTRSCKNHLVNTFPNTCL